MRAVVNVEELQGRTCLVVTELPYQVNPDNLAIKIADLVKDGKITGIADIRDETSGRTGQRLVIVLKRDAVAKVVLNNLYKHTQLQENFGANMLAIVDGVPRTLPLDGFIRHWVTTRSRSSSGAPRYRLRKAEEERTSCAAPQGARRARRGHRAHPPLHTTDDARDGLMELLEIDELQADAILDMQLRRLAALERQKILDRHAELEAQIADYKAILADRGAPARHHQRRARRDRRQVRRRPPHQDPAWATTATCRIEDLIPEEEMVVTVTRGGYIKRTRSDNYRSQHRGGKGVKGAQLRADDVVEHFFVTTTHHWLLFFTNMGRVYRAKAYEVPEAGRDAKGQHVANLLALQPDEEIAQILDIRDYSVARTWCSPPARPGQEDPPRGVRHQPLRRRHRDQPARRATNWSRRCSFRETDDILLVSRMGQSLRFTATDDALRPMGRSTSGVKGMKFREDDELLAAAVVTRRLVRLRRHRGRLRQAHRRRPVPPAEPRRPRHQGRQVPARNAAIWPAP